MPYEIYLVHHGRKGQHWGIKNGPPYPLKFSGSYLKKVKRKQAEFIVSDINKAKKHADLNKRIASDPKLKKSNIRALKTVKKRGMSLAVTGKLLTASVYVASPMLGPFISGGAMAASNFMGTYGTIKSYKAGRAIKDLKNPARIDKRLDKKIKRGEEYLARLGFKLEKKSINKDNEFEYQLKKTK